MTLSRLYLSAPRAETERAATVCESLFALEAYPLALVESADGSDIWCLSVYVPAESAMAQLQRANNALRQAGIGAALLVETLPDKDWVAQSLRELAPVRAGGFIVHGSHDGAPGRPHGRSILVDASQAFGTGHHGTTAGCLEMLRRCLKLRRFHAALDVGTGTGVLAIAIARSLPIRVFASDIDPVSVEIARENARLNQVGPQLRILRAAGLAHREIAAAAPFDLVVANILARPLQALAPGVAHCLAPGATVILSGLLPHQRAPVLAAYREQNLYHSHSHYADGWLTLVLQSAANRRPKPPVRRLPPL